MTIPLNTASGVHLYGWLRAHLGVAVTAGVLFFGGCDCDGDDDQTAAPCATCADVDGDHVLFPDEVGAEHSGLVLFSGWRRPKCEYDMLCAATSDLYLGDVRWGPNDFGEGPDESAGCKKEFIAFTAGKGPYVGDAPDGEIVVAFPEATKVDVKLWLVYPTTPPSATEKEAAVESVQDDTVTAARLFEELGTGIDLDFEIEVMKLQASSNGGSFSCQDDAETIAARTNGYDSKALNVYYVSSVEVGYAGVNCYNTSGTGSSYQNIMFVNSTLWYAPMQLAHELGHALGLLRSQPVAATATATVADDRVGTEFHQGDVDELLLDPYLPEDNLMKSSGTQFNSVTVGQIYRMHFDQLSWLNHGLATSATGYPRVCQDDPSVAGFCPPLTLSPPRGWP